MVSVSKFQGVYKTCRLSWSPSDTVYPTNYAEETGFDLCFGGLLATGLTHIIQG